MSDAVISYNEIDAQPYSDSKLSAGLMSGAEPDTIYLRFERDNEESLTIHLRPDEAIRIAALLANSVWSTILLEKD